MDKKQMGTYREQGSKASSYTVGFRRSQTALFDWTFFRLDSSGPPFCCCCCCCCCCSHINSQIQVRGHRTGPSHSGAEESSSVESISCDCALSGGGWCEGIYCWKAVESRLEALCFVRFPRATRASRATNPRPSGLVALGVAEKPPKLRSWRCTQPRAAKPPVGGSRCWQIGNKSCICDGFIHTFSTDFFRPADPVEKVNSFERFRL